MQLQTINPPSSLPSDLSQDINNILADAPQWLETPNEHLGGLTPQDMIDRNLIEPLRNLVGMIKHGMMT